MRRVLSLLLILVAGCGPPTTGAADGTTRPGRRCADVVGVDAVEGGGTWRFDVTVASEETGWEAYADVWEVRDPAGAVLGVRELAHPHVDEQPFTRSLSGVEIPDGVVTVEVAARHSEGGWCGETMTVGLLGR